MSFRSQLFPQYPDSVMALLSLLDTASFEPFFLVRATRRARTLSESARSRMKPWVSAARARQRVALELRDEASRPIAFGLLRDAAFFALCALVVAEGDVETPASPSLGLAWLEDHSSTFPASPANSARGRTLLADLDPLHFDRISLSAEAGELRVSAEALVAWLLRCAEVRTPRQILRARCLRIGFLLGALLLVSWSLVAYGLTLSALSAAR
jgi:hypothetical protein